jgi:hypothetical protein
MMLAGALARVVDPEGEAVFATKGAIAMELRMGDRARATRDVDLVLRGESPQLADLLDDGLREPYEGFAFRRSDIASLPLRAHIQQVTIQVSFAGRVFSSPRLEIAPTETGKEEFVAIAGAPLDAVGLDGPELVLVLAEPWQIAQKLHAVTEDHPNGRENSRFRDLIGLQMLEALDPDLDAVRDACERVFAVRAMQPWPPTLVVAPSWAAPLPGRERRARIAVGLGCLACPGSGVRHDQNFTAARSAAT